MSGAYELTSRDDVAQEVANRILGRRLEYFRVWGPQKEIEDKRTYKYVREREGASSSSRASERARELERESTQARERASERASEREWFVAHKTHGMHEQFFYGSEVGRHNTHRWAW